MSKGFMCLVDELQGNFEAVVNFLEDPGVFIDSYAVTSEERSALMSRDFDALAEMCGSEQLAVGVLSGAHSSGCGNLTTRY